MNFIPRLTSHFTYSKAIAYQICSNAGVSVYDKNNDEIMLDECTKENGYEDPGHILVDMRDNLEVLGEALEDAKIQAANPKEVLDILEKNPKVEVEKEEDSEEDNEGTECVEGPKIVFKCGHRVVLYAKINEFWDKSDVWFLFDNIIEYNEQDYYVVVKDARVFLSNTCYGKAIVRVFTADDTAVNSEHSFALCEADAKVDGEDEKELHLVKVRWKEEEPAPEEVEINNWVRRTSSAAKYLSRWGASIKKLTIHNMKCRQAFPLYEILEYFPNLEYLSVENLWGLSTLDFADVESLKSLKYLSLGHTGITRILGIDETLFKDVQSFSIRTAPMSRNLVKTIKMTFPKLNFSVLKDLDIISGELMAVNQFSTVVTFKSGERITKVGLANRILGVEWKVLPKTIRVAFIPSDKSDFERIPYGVAGIGEFEQKIKVVFEMLGNECIPCTCTLKCVEEIEELENE